MLKPWIVSTLVSAGLLLPLPVLPGTAAAAPSPRATITEFQLPMRESSLHDRYRARREPLVHRSDATRSAASPREAR